jgi:hypothetical protein
LTEFRVEKIPLKQKRDGIALPRLVLRTYLIILSHMRRQNRRVIWLHDAALCRLIAVSQHELGKIVAVLRETGYLGVRQSNYGCEYSHIEGAVSIE